MCEAGSLTPASNEPHGYLLMLRVLVCVSRAFIRDSLSPPALDTPFLHALCVLPPITLNNTSTQTQSPKSPFTLESSQTGTCLGPLRKPGWGEGSKAHPQRGQRITYCRQSKVRPRLAPFLPPSSRVRGPARGRQRAAKGALYFFPFPFFSCFNFFCSQPFAARASQPRS